MKDKRVSLKHNYANPYLHKPLAISKRIRTAGFAEKQAELSHITMNYVEGPKNGPPLVLNPLKWEPGKAIIRSYPYLPSNFGYLPLMFADTDAAAGRPVIIPGTLLAKT